MSVGCQTPQSASDANRLTLSNERHIKQFGDFLLPQKIGAVPNIHLQLPVISPDGCQMLYLQTDRPNLSPMTLLGSPDPSHTPTDGSLSIWIRPTSGTVPGRRLSQSRWSHSPVWSDSGRAVCYVVNEPPSSYIVHLALAGGAEHKLGLPNAINCLPRFDRNDDETILFCSGISANGPFRLHRQSPGQTQPEPLTPEGMDCLFPVHRLSNGDVVCAQTQGDQLNWVQANVNKVTPLIGQGGTAQRPHLLQTFSGITSPRSPDGRDFLFYDSWRNRIAAYHSSDQQVIRHRSDSIAACWLGNDAIALATSQGVFAVNTITGLSPILFDGTWIPCRYVPTERKLLLLGRDNPSRFSIVELVFKTK